VSAHRFVVNLRPETLAGAFRDALVPQDYSLPGMAVNRARSKVHGGAGLGADGAAGGRVVESRSGRW
jgi:hypothetical protein